MSNYVPESPPPDTKRRKKTNDEVSPSWSSLPNELVVSCLALVSRLDHATVSLVSKSHRSLVTSPELCRTRSMMGCTEACFYICLRIFPDQTPRWFFLTHNRRLIPIPSYPYQAQKSSSFVVVDWGIYVIGGLINGNPTSDVLFLDCFSHTWHRVPSMKMARASAYASLVNGKIYVSRGCKEDAYSAEVFDLKTQTWDTLKITQNIHQSMVIEEKKVFAVDEKNQSFFHLPSEVIRRRGRRYYRPRNRNRKDWCVIGNLLYRRSVARGRIEWCEPNELEWKEVEGLDKLRQSISGWRRFPYRPAEVKYGISSLSSNSDGNIIVIFWKSKLEDPKSLEIWKAKISLERRERGGRCDIWGKIECSDDVFKLDPLSLSSRDKVLYSASVHV